MPAHLNLPSLSARSEERQVRSTENLSRFTRRIRQWIVIPICVSVRSGRKRGGGGGEGGQRGKEEKSRERKGRRQKKIHNNQVLILCQYPPSPPSSPQPQRTQESSWTHVHSLLWCVHRLVTDVLGEDEPAQTILEPRPHPNTLTRTTTIIKVLPYLRK